MARLIIYFWFSGLLGWLYETFVMTVYTGKWDNRGVLYGPLLPIYAVGCVGITYVVPTFFPTAGPAQVFLIGVVGSAVLELSTSYGLEKMFNRTWWDYSISPLNYHGRICAPASVGFGIAAVLVIYVYNPFVWGMIENLSDTFCLALACIASVTVILDIIFTVRTLCFGFEGFETYDRLNNHMDQFVDEHWPFESTICDKVHERIDS